MRISFASRYARKRSVRPGAPMMSRSADTPGHQVGNGIWSAVLHTVLQIGMSSAPRCCVFQPLPRKIAKASLSVIFPSAFSDEGRAAGPTSASMIGKRVSIACKMICTDGGRDNGLRTA